MWNDVFLRAEYKGHENAQREWKINSLKLKLGHVNLKKM